MKLRPRGASGGDFATFSLRAADAQVLAANERLSQGLGGDPNAWISLMEQLKPQQAAVAAALLSSPNAPKELRHNLQCSNP
ncbi:MAG: hypothetical protein QM522_12395 [Chitinophagaceae bacterium]|nr:hypothetical protein [Chitinophagaceae bacterium]